MDKLTQLIQWMDLDQYRDQLWWAMMIGAVIIVWTICRATFYGVISLIATAIIKSEIRALATILIPSHFNRQDFGKWMNTKNILFNDRSPSEMISDGLGHRLICIIQEQMMSKTMPELYDGVLAI